MRLADPAGRGLRYRWGVLAGLAGLLLLAGSGQWGLRWGALAGLALAYVLWLVWQGLPLNTRPGETTLLPNFGPGNRLTLARGLAIGLLAGFLAVPRPGDGLAGWLPAILYTLASIADGLDGYVARRAGHATQLGAVLDMDFDALGVLVVCVLGVQWGQLAPVYLLLGVARYLFVWGGRWREWRGHPLHPIPESSYRRMVAGFQMGFLTVVLWPIVPPAGSYLAGLVFIIPTLLVFARDWLVASGHIDVASPRYQVARRQTIALTTGWLPAGLRLLILPLMLWVGLLPPDLSGWPAWVALFGDWGLPRPQGLALLLGLVALVAGPALALGVVGRLAAFGVMLATAIDFVTLGADVAARPGHGLLLVASLVVLLAGSGRYALWQPEEPYMHRRLGEKQP